MSENQGKLASYGDVDSQKLSYKSSRCSCLDCDSVSCFAKRYKPNKEKCQCEVCKDIGNCLFLPKKTQEKKPKDNTNKKIVREVITRETIESLKKVTETMYEFCNKDFQMVMERQSKNNTIQIKPAQGSSETKTINVCEDKAVLKKIDKNECYTQKPIALAPSKDNNNTVREGHDVKKLSAQIMNVPYEDLKESESSNQTIEYKLNIFKRIKEIYDACSCKVCECIISKPVSSTNGVCKCEPCNCQDCANIQTGKPPSGCPCIRCNRDSCRGIAKNACATHVCDCNATECVGESSEKLNTKLCVCESCHCMRSSPLHNHKHKTVKLGPVDNIIEKEICTCMPCECIECKEIYNRTNPTVMCSVSTEMSRYRNCRCEECPNQRCQLGETETCTCERYNRTMKKSFKNNCTDYDIRTVTIDNNNPFNQREKHIFKQQNTISLIASLQNNYRTTSIDGDACKCNNCECIICTGKEKTSRFEGEARLTPNIKLIQNDVSFPAPITNACICEPCECEVCTRKGRDERFLMQSKCRCDICDCLNCDNAPLTTCNIATKTVAKPIKNSYIANKCNCNFCECINCKKELNCDSNIKENFYSNDKTSANRTHRGIRKVVVISPTDSESYPQKSYIKSSCSLNPNKHFESVYRQTSTSHSFSCDEPDNQLPNNKHYVTMKLNKGNNSPTNNDVLFNFNKDKMANMKIASVQVEPILKFYNNITCKTLKILESKDNLTAAKCKSFNVIHEIPDKITLDDSEESLPVFWTYHNATSYASNLGDVNTPKCDSKKTLNKSCEIKCDQSNSFISSNKEKYTSKKKEKEINLKALEMDKIKTFLGDPLLDSIKRFNFNRNNDKYTSVCDDLSLLSNTYIEAFGTPIRNHNVKNTITSATDHSVSLSYERASTILQEAKAFSTKLVKMLESFERANRKYESRSRKLKNLHKSLLNINKVKLTEDYNKMLKKISRSVKSGIPFENILESYNFMETVEESQNENKAEKEYEHCTSTCKTLDDNDKLQNNHDINLTRNSAVKVKPSKVILEGNTLSRQKIEVNNLDENIERLEETISHTDANFARYSALNHINSDTQATEILTLTESQLQITRLEDNLDFVTGEVSAGSSGQNQFNSETRKKMENMDLTNPKLQIIPSERKLDSVSNDISGTTNNKEQNTEPNSEKEDRLTWDLLKKNLYLSIPKENTRNTLKSPALELDVKEAVHRMTLQELNYELSRFVPKSNDALTKLRSEVNNLLNIPLLQTSSQAKCTSKVEDIKPKNSLDLESKRMVHTASSQTYERMVTKADKGIYFNDQDPEGSCRQSDKDDIFYKAQMKPSNRITNQAEGLNKKNTSKSSCEPYRVSFVGLRRISDHTVLVKWDIPKCLKDVEGYELLVNGRAVQKILSPGRNMAVLTCLPHAERVLLTVRTLAAAGACDHLPAASVLYRPRIK